MSFRVVIPRPGSAAMRIAAGGAATMADGSCVASRGGTVVHASAIWRRGGYAEAGADGGGTPLVVEFRHRAAASGLIAPNPSKRDPNRPSEAEILASRALDRALRPRFKSDLAVFEKVNVTCTVHASDGVYDPVALAANACSAALALADTPWAGPVGTVRIGTKKSASASGPADLVVDPALAFLADGGFDLLYAGSPTREAALMCELGCEPRYTDAFLASALRFAHAETTLLADAQAELARHCRDPTKEPPRLDDVLLEALEVARAATADLKPRFVSLFQGKMRLSEDGASVEETSEKLVLDKKTRGQCQGMLTGRATEAAFAALEGAANEKVLRRRRQEAGPTPSLVEAASEPSSDAPLLWAKAKALLLQHEEKAAAAPKEEKAASPPPLPTEAALWALASRRGTEAMMRSAFASAALESRVDGRIPSELRPLRVETAVLPCLGPGNPHGSSRFARGETEVQATVVLDAPPRARMSQLDEDPSAAFAEHASFRRTQARERKRAGSDASAVEGPLGTPADLDRRLIVHYEFPSHATAAASAAASANRRAIGHGALAERALAPLFPTRTRFPYTVRVAADVLSSNGSSSMATVVAASLALFDAGVPMIAPVAGVSVGAVGSEEDDDSATPPGGGLLVDLNGTEDHFGDMDFKVAGTRDHVTAIQLDVKPKDGVSLNVLEEALALAKTARNEILDAMTTEEEKNTDEQAPSDGDADADAPTTEEVHIDTPFVIEPVARPGIIAPTKGGLRQPRGTLRPNAPMVEVIRYNPERLLELLGRSGQTLKDLEKEHRCRVEVHTPGELTLFARNAGDCARAYRAILEVVADVEIGAELVGTVHAIREYGAVIKVLRDREGLLHISELHGHPENPEVIKEGDVLRLICIGVDPILGHIKFSRRGLPEFSLSHPYFSSKDQANEDSLR